VVYWYMKQKISGSIIRDFNVDAVNASNGDVLTYDSTNAR